MRATFGIWGGLFPLLMRSVLALVWTGIQTWFGGLFMDIMLESIFGYVHRSSKNPVSLRLTIS